MKFKVLILGGGSGGISVAAMLSRSLPSGAIGILDPAQKHYYQPLWTLAGAGLFDKEKSSKSESHLIPSGVRWVRESVLSVDPVKQVVRASGDLEISYEFLVVATGLRLAWEKVPGAKEALGTQGVCSIYEYDHIDYTAKTIQGFQGGKAIFVMPPVPIKCAGAPQKIMYLAENVFRNQGVRHKVQIQFATAGKGMFGIPTFSDALTKLVEEKGIEPLYQHKIIGVDGARKVARFSVTAADASVQEKELPFDLLHIVPPMAAHAFVEESGLAVSEGDQKGWLAVDKFSLQHLKYPNVFGVGDVTGVPNSKTGAAIRKQYPVVVENLRAAMEGKPLEAKYDGYSSCPLITEIGKVMLAEFGYDGKLMPTFPLDPAVSRRSMWYLKKDLLPKLYWYGMMKGLA